MRFPQLPVRRRSVLDIAQIAAKSLPPKQLSCLHDRFAAGSRLPLGENQTRRSFPTSTDNRDSRDWTWKQTADEARRMATHLIAQGWPWVRTLSFIRRIVHRGFSPNSCLWSVLARHSSCLSLTYTAVGAGFVFAQRSEIFPPRTVGHGRLNLQTGTGGHSLYSFLNSSSSDGMSWDQNAGGSAEPVTGDRRAKPRNRHCHLHIRHPRKSPRGNAPISNFPLLGESDSSGIR